MNLSALLGNFFKPVTDVINKFIPDANAKLEASQAILLIQAEMATKALEYEKTLAQEQGQTIRAEAQSQSWVARNWRPLIMLLFGYIIFHSFVLAPVFKVPAVEIPPDMWDLLRLGLGGYVIGRSAEKIIPEAVKALKK